MKIPAKIFRLAVSFVFIAAVLWTMAPGQTAPAQAQAIPSGKVLSVTRDRVRYHPGSDVNITVEIQNDGPVEQDYQLAMILVSPSGQQVYHSVSEGINPRLTLGPGAASGPIPFRWTTGSKTEAGSFTVRVVLRDYIVFNKVFHEVEQSSFFEVQARPLMYISRNSLDFGGFKPGETPEQILIVSNAGNGTLTWQVADWPKGWVDLISPIGEVTGTATIRLKVRPDALLFEYLQGDLIITSDALVEDKEIPLKASIEGSIGGTLVRVRPLDTSYRQGNNVELEYTIRNSGTVALDYRATMTVLGPQGNVVYSSSGLNEDRLVSLTPDLSETVRFAWKLPVDAPVGLYSAYVGLSYWHDSRLIFYDYLDEGFVQTISGPPINAVFEVREGPRLSVEPASWDFGTVLPGNAARAKFKVDNAGAATIEWRIESVPDWLDLALPSNPVGVGAGDILVRLKPSTPEGQYEGVIRLTSNGGDRDIPLSLNIQSPATPTPSPTSTPLPTATPEPTAIPEPPTATPEPTATATPIPPTSTPTSTPIQPTATSMPPTATPMPEATPTAVQVAQAELPTPEPTPEPSGGGCGAPLGLHIPVATKLLNLALLFAPIGLIWGVKLRRR